MIVDIDLSFAEWRRRSLAAGAGSRRRARRYTAVQRHGLHCGYLYHSLLELGLLGRRGKTIVEWSLLLRRHSVFLNCRRLLDFGFLLWDLVCLRRSLIGKYGRLIRCDFHRLGGGGN